LDLLRETGAYVDEIFSRAVITRSPYIILIHNHPSGDPKPSPEDKITMHALIEAAKPLKKSILDFIIVGEKKYWSMFEELEGGEYTLGSGA
jgi:DNA repair protein RadC